MATPIIKTHDSDPSTGDLGTGFCGICRRQTSRYTCPSCNLSYCSLNCFRSEPHSQCSERFYRKEVEARVNSASSKTEEDKDKILGLLKRIEDQDTVDESGLIHPSDEENEEDSITHRFSEIDVSSASADDLLGLLTAKERDRFFSALREPSSGLAQELLASAELDKTRQPPWWEAPTDGGQSAVSVDVPYGVRPDLMEVPTNLIHQPSREVSLLYNICAMLLAYAYVTRHLSMSPLASVTHDPQDQREARRILSQSVPFLTDHKSKWRHTSLTDAVISFWSRFNPGSISPKTMMILLEDVSAILRPRRITFTECSSDEREGSTALGANHPSATAIMAISDISTLFSAAADSSVPARRGNHIVMKLTFYSARILSTPSSRLHTLADQVDLLSKSIGKEAG